MTETQSLDLEPTSVRSIAAAALHATMNVPRLCAIGLLAAVATPAPNGLDIGTASRSQVSPVLGLQIAVTMIALHGPKPPTGLDIGSVGMVGVPSLRQVVETIRRAPPRTLEGGLSHDGLSVNGLSPTTTRP